MKPTLRVAQDPQVEPQGDARGSDIHSRPFQVGEKLPMECGVSDVARVLRISISRVHQMRKQGKLNRFLLEPLGDGKARYSGRKLQQWIDGESGERHFFGSVGKRA